MENILDAISSWVSGIPLPALYALLFLTSYIEGIFPPVPGDIAVALIAFIAARAGANFTITAVLIIVGSVFGAMTMYALARRYGAAWMHARLKKAGVDNLEKRLEVMYSRYGMTALLVSRMIPFIRMIGPPMAGAIRIPPIRTAFVFTIVSTVWYGAITWMAFQVGDDWDDMRLAVAHFARQVGVVALFALGLIVAIVIIVMKRRAAAKLEEALRITMEQTPPTGIPVVEQSPKDG
jgi:membrane protein DedA with SNARE-associated domain